MSPSAVVAQPRISQVRDSCSFFPAPSILLKIHGCSTPWEGRGSGRAWLGKGTASAVPPERQSYAASAAEGQRSSLNPGKAEQLGAEFLAGSIAIEIGFLALPRYLQRLQLKSRKPPPREHDPLRKFPALRY
jgi:hypothetical protein